MTKNTDSTRYYSRLQEEYLSKKLNAKLTPNSGAGIFRKGDLFTQDFLIECKTCIKDKESFSIKKEWLEKNKLEAFTQRKPYHTIAFNFGPNTDNYFIIDEKLMKYLMDKLQEEDY